MRFPVAEHQNQTKQICISPAPGRSSKLTHTCVGIDTGAFHTGCLLSSAASGMSLELCFLTQFQWHEANVLDNWQLAALPQSGGCEFDPRRVHDNLLVPLWVYMRFPVPEHQNQTKQIYIYTFRKFQCNAIPQTCPRDGHEWIITSNIFLWKFLFIHIQNSFLL